MLSHYEKLKKNNYTLIRLILAWTVLFGHAFPITGTGSDPLSIWMLPHTWIGRIAVGGFFTVSGFLITSSFTRRGLLPFAIARVLRIYPAVIVYSLLAVFFIGPIETNLSIHEYFDAHAWKALLNIPLWDWRYELPHLFATNPIANTSNGSMWTLPVELRCYLLIFSLGLIGTLRARLHQNIALLAVLYCISVHFENMPFISHNQFYRQPILFFITGSLAWVNRDIIPLNYPLAVIFFAANLISINTSLFLPVHVICVSYVIFLIAYRTPHFNLDRWGDISYGVYIYAWPIQQIVWREGQNAYTNTALATAIVIPIAYASWKLIEEPAMKLRHKIFTQSTSPRVIA